jgi:hypothetical protein
MHDLILLLSNELIGIRVLSFFYFQCTSIVTCKSRFIWASLGENSSRRIRPWQCHKLHRWESVKKSNFSNCRRIISVTFLTSLAEQHYADVILGDTVVSQLHCCIYVTNALATALLCPIASFEAAIFSNVAPNAVHYHQITWECRVSRSMKNLDPSH